jgi:hypothetical protein
MKFEEFKKTAIFEERVEEWSDELEQNETIFVYAKRGFAFDPHPDERQAAHVSGFDTEAEAIEGVKTLERCACAYCKGLVD